MKTSVELGPRLNISKETPLDRVQRDVTEEEEKIEFVAYESNWRYKEIVCNCSMIWLEVKLQRSRHILNKTLSN